MSNSKYKALYKDNKKSQVHSIFLIAVVLTIAFLVFNVVGLNAKLLIVLLGAIAFGIAFVNTEFALILLIFSMLLSPELSAGSAGRREVVIRADDIFLGVVVLGWLARMAVIKELALFKGTYLNVPIINYISLCIIATLWGILNGIVFPLSGLFYSLKYIEYFLLFFMVANTIHDRAQIKRYIYSLLIVFTIISVYAWFQHLIGVARVSAPFEGRQGEANTLGAYIVLLISVCAGIFFNDAKNKYRFSLMVAMVLAIPALLFTLSRGSWLGFIGAFIAFFFVTKRGKPWLVLLVLMVSVSSAWIFPSAVKERFAYTFEEQTEYQVLGRKITLDESAAARVDSWTLGLNKWSKRPILGHGIGNPGVVIDNQYTRVLIETGLIGFILFSVVIVTIFKLLKRNLAIYADDGFVYGLSCGLIAGLVGLLFHSFTAATFILIRVMEPFWFLVALAIVLPRIDGKEETLEAKYG